MRISQLSLEGRGAWPDLHVDSLNRHLNVFYGTPRAGKSTIARLASHLLYGKTDSPWRKQFGQSIPLTEGTITLESEQGKYFLRRHCDTNNQVKLTIASTEGNLVDSQTLRSLLFDLPPELTSRLFAVDFAESPPVEWLLSDTFSRQYIASHQATHQSQNPNGQQATTPVDRQRLDGLVGLRDAVALEIEQQLALRRQESGVLVREITELDATLAEKRKHEKQLLTQVRSLEKALIEVEVRLRYYSLEATTQKTPDAQASAAHQKQLAELDTEISRCRQTLSDLNAREVVVRNELAQLTADGTADSVTCLADGRATLSAMERLLDDLDAEVSQLARANEPGRSINPDSHTRLSPVAEMLRMQVYTLCGQLTEQERVARRQQVTTESRQLARAQVDLGERLEQLLSRRESLIQQDRQIGQPVLLMPQTPAEEHCQCEHHDQFLESAESMQLGRRDRQQLQDETQQHYASLERKRVRLANELAALHSHIEQLDLRWKHLQSERAGLIGGVSLEENQAELERLEKLIQETLQQPVTQAPVSHVETWRASDVLAQFTDGQLVQIHLDRNKQTATVIDQAGSRLTIDSLSPAHHDAVYLALTIALVGSYSQNGITMPLILDEPFLRQDAASAAAMAGVLDEFSKAGHQVFVFTEDHHARRQFESLGPNVHDLEKIRHRPAASPPQVDPEPPTTTSKINTQIVRQTLGTYSGPSLRLAPTDGESDDLFYLAATSSFDEFPILGKNTTQLFSAINIHTVDDLLTADAKEVASRLDLRKIGHDAVQLWQTHMGLMCYVPEITLNDAQLLSAAGISSPNDLFKADTETFFRNTTDFLDSDHGQQFAPTRNRYNRNRLNNWILGAKRYRERWLNSKRSTPLPSKKPQPATLRVHRFYLETNSDIEAAPSIGPKTATRLTKVGIRTVADLLNADPESVSEELDVSHIKSVTVANWQHQARLVCQIPLLRGFGAQLLVACGFTEPEQINAADTADIVETILALCETKKGQRILRNTDTPSQADIEAWINSAANTRPLEAA